tara:strand:- start:315 stop:758 length:444 start_codon:yes stop_codon:yes gene_type:complete
MLYIPTRRERYYAPHYAAMTNPHRFEYTDDVDDRILELVKIHGRKWRFIAAKLDNVISDDAIRNRYMRLLGITPKPSGRHSPSNSVSRRHWSEEEDEQLARAVQQYGMKWDQIRTFEFPERTRQSLRNRAQRMGFKLLILMTSDAMQ